MKHSSFFLSFCLLVALRDAFSHKLLVESVDPVALLLVFCVTCWTLSAGVLWIRERNFNMIMRWFELTRQQQVTFVKLGLATWVVYAVTIFAISRLGAATFNLVDYGAMPLLTLFSGLLIAQERPAWNEIFGTLISTLGLLMFLAFPIAGDLSNWRLWIVLALLSPIATAISSAYQYQQIRQGLSPETVLLFRFPIPMALMLVWFLVERPSISLRVIPATAMLAACGVWLPLWLLCYGFMRSSLSQFSMYLVLIPILTFAAGPLLVEGEIEKISHPIMVVASVLIVVGYVVGMRKPKEPSST